MGTLTVDKLNNFCWILLFLVGSSGEAGLQERFCWGDLICEPFGRLLVWKFYVDKDNGQFSLQVGGVYDLLEGLRAAAWRHLICMLIQVGRDEEVLGLVVRLLHAGRVIDSIFGIDCV